MFASFAACNELGYSVRLRGFSPVEDETDLGSNEHVKYLDYVLELFGKSKDNVICFIGDTVIQTNVSLTCVACLW